MTASACGIPEEKWFWAKRIEYSIDGWEVGNGSGETRKENDGTDCIFSHPQETVNEGYISLANSDSHKIEHMKTRGLYHNYIFVKERSDSGVKEALLERRIVAYCNGEIFGQEKYLMMYKNVKKK